MQVIITGRVADSAGVPENGRIEFAQAQRFDTGELLVTGSLATAQVVAGELRTLSGEAFTMPVNVEGTAVRVREILGGQTFEWWTAIPDLGSVEYRELPIVESSSVPASVWGPPPWLVEAQQMRDETVSAIEEGREVAEALGGLAGINSAVDQARSSAVEAGESAALAAGASSNAEASAVRAEEAAGSVNAEEINARLDGMDSQLSGKVDQSDFDNRVSNQFNILDFGAVGDGVTDDKAALQAALDAATAAGSVGFGLKGEVICPPGRVYLIGSQTIIRANTILTLYGAELRKPAGANFPWFRNFQAGQDNFPGYSGNGNILVRGGTINGQAQTGPSPAGNNMCFEHAENIEVRDVTFLNAGSGQVHALEYNAIKDGRIIRCRFLGYNSHGKIAEAIQLDIAVSGSGNLPPADETTCTDIVVHGCMMDKSAEAGYWGALVGSHMARSGRRYGNIRITDNIVFGSIENGIRMHQWQEAIVSGNTIIDAASNGILCEVGSGANASGTNRVLISGNIVRGCGNGIAVAGSAGAEFREVIVSNNIIRDVTTDGINVNRTDRATIIGNSVTAAGEDGIQVHNSKFNGILNNRINACGRYGILGSPGLNDSSIIGNYVAGTASDSIRISSGSSRNLVTANTVRKDGGAGQYACSMSADSEDNMVYGNDMLGTGGVTGGTRTILTATNRT